ncbi:retrovirus-related pol polyprotein from transposon TNT 1-94 [Tanacetum coccineum]
MPYVEPALPVPLTTEPASSDEQHRASVESAENGKMLESNIIKKNDSILITKKSILGTPKNSKQPPILKLGQGHGKSVFLGYSPNSKAYIVLNKETMKVEESLNVKFDETPPPKSSPLVDDDILENDIIEDQDKDLKVKENEPLNKEISNIKSSKDHPLGTIIGNLNERTLRSQVQNQSNFFCFVSSVEPKNIKEAIQDESWTMAMQEELNQFKTNDVWSLVPPPKNQTIIDSDNEESQADLQDESLSDIDSDDDLESRIFNSHSSTMLPQGGLGGARPTSPNTVTSAQQQQPLMSTSSKDTGTVTSTFLFYSVGVSDVF